jgi:hypothetical protein
MAIWRTWTCVGRYAASAFSEQPVVEGQVAHCARRQFEGRQSAPPTVPDKLLALADEVIEEAADICCCDTSGNHRPERTTALHPREMAATTAAE